MKCLLAVSAIFVWALSTLTVLAQEEPSVTGSPRAALVSSTAGHVKPDEPSRVALTGRFAAHGISRSPVKKTSAPAIDLKLDWNQLSETKIGPLPVRKSGEDATSSKDSNSADSMDTAMPKAGFQWGPALRQSLLFLAVQHGYAVTQPKTRHALRGSFFKDYFRSVKSLRGWDDGGRFFTNYVAHPMEGSFTGFIQIHNDPSGRSQTFGKSSRYWKSRMKALAWSAAWSTQFELGPLSQASIGNVGLKGKQTYVDLVVTPTFGLGLLVTEDILDKYVVRRLEAYSGGLWMRMFSRTLLNPTRAVANMIRFKLPWYRDPGLRP
jgi:hypothetical protein